MPQTINAGLTLPANVVTDGTIQASDVSLLYNTLNALSVPDSIAALFQAGITTSTGTSTPLSTGSVVLTGGTSTTAVTQDLGLTAVPAAKALFFLGSYSWATTGLALQLQFRLNSTGFALPNAITTSTSGSGLWFIILGPHDGTAAFPTIGWLTGSTGVVTTFTANVALPNAASTSIGIAALFGTSTNGSTSSTLTWNFADVWRRT